MSTQFRLRAPRSRCASSAPVRSPRRWWLPSCWCRARRPGTTTTTTIRGKFLRGKHIWSTQVATPFDGDFRARVTAPGSGADDVKILSGDGRTLLATGSWNGSRGKSAEYRVCGARSVKVRVIRAVAAARFTLQVQVP